ncbi:unnamed protein product [Aphanomyces euteiches]
MNAYAATDAWCLVHMIREIYANNPTLVVSMQQSVKMNEHEDLKSAQEIAGIVERRRAQFSQETRLHMSWYCLNLAKSIWPYLLKLLDVLDVVYVLQLLKNALRSIMETELPLLAGGGLHHLIECSNSESLKELCGENEVKVAALCKGSSNAAATSDDNKLRFLSDSNLGKVSRWLRMRGVDIVQFDDLDRSKFLDQAITEKRIILTSDRKLAQRRSAAAYFLVSSDDPRKQFPEIIKHFGLSTTGEVSEPRCSRCNCDGFRMVDRETARNAQRIPEETLETISEYWQCQACKKIFWTAWKRFQAMRFQDKQADDSVDDSGDVDGADNREDKA